ncbi:MULTISPECIES: Lrp/AsnC family transcriptional regulator [Janthinobacterium]|uniref:Lrp/AsnC family transcriptional regulator n=1 Tax=Janthinobacterium rivuli TaxID=2751478 RepID=A0ABY8I5E7_9BURK|nr:MULTISPECIES: Lrp/AsnC family transcriptional regulator [Janthinobacterium]PHV34067.1 Lrp/AsnC family transcriptional regulator [Janthinobacterium sp. BJB312]KKO66178.1 Leucine-responsive regulatory protein [Janthinobacterium sp. KBS0711]MBW3510133.1 Lrp/AsnC family transcriptional regulator [Janthinobacterium sp. NKUCC06_STL]MCA1862339.1 Lrp/AsnC family transcriptional regulator [Janthinobacterium lividum]NHQ88902.1 Lrp/AsnC family transcriptional regulator [Janthinobacterium lividum]
MSKITLDKTDRKILAVLQADGRLSNQDVAEQVSLSPSPCLRRVKRLEEAGVIRQYVALLDPEKIGLGLLAYVNVRLEKHSDASAHAHSTARVLAPNLVTNTSPRADFAVAVAQWPEVVACYAMTGEMDYLLRVHVEDMEHFSRFMMATLLRHPAVLDVKSSFALQRIKDTTALPLL